MHNSKSVLENRMHKILWDFEIQTDHLTSVTRLDLVPADLREKQKKAKRVTNT